MACMHATCVEDLQVFQRARAFAVAVFAITDRFQADFWLRDQLTRSAASIAANIAEGFPQGTDRAFARYLSVAAGSAEEARAHLTVAEERGRAASTAVSDLRQEALEIVRMLNALIRHLRRSDRKDRNV
jgi:four helix bundle protein